MTILIRARLVTYFYPLATAATAPQFRIGQNTLSIEEVPAATLQLLDEPREKDCEGDKTLFPYARFYWFLVSIH